MDINSLCDLIGNKTRIEALKSIIANKRIRVISLYGLAGSSPSVIFSSLPLKKSAKTLIICNDADEAGYMYHDLCQINGEGRVLIFPSGYKRDIKYGQLDAPSEIMRTEVLNQWYENDNLRLVVSYP